MFPYPVGVLAARVGCTSGHLRAWYAAEYARAVLSALAERGLDTLSELMRGLHANNEFEYRDPRRSRTTGQSWVAPGAREALREGLTGLHVWQADTAREWLQRITAGGSMCPPQPRKMRAGPDKLAPWHFLDRGKVVAWPPPWRSFVAEHHVFTIPNRYARLAAGVRPDDTVEEASPERCFCHRFEELLSDSRTCLKNDAPAIESRSALEKICAPFAPSALYPEVDFSQAEDSENLLMIRRNSPADFVARYLRHGQ